MKQRTKKAGGHNLLISMFFVIKIFLTKSMAVINFNYAVTEGLMSRELRDKADVMIKELKEVLVPLSAEINRMKNTPENSINDDYFTG